MPEITPDTGRRTKQLATVGAVGYVGGLIGEIIGHGEFGHRNKRTHSIIRNLGALSWWVAGANPPPFAGWHRRHHATGGGGPRSPVRTVIATLQEVYVSEKRGLAGAQEAYDKSPEAVTFGLPRETDPSLTYDANGRPNGFKYEGVNKFFKKIPFKLGHYVLPVAAVGVATAYHKLTEGVSTGTALKRGAVDYGMLLLAAAQPNSAAPLLEWSKGGETATDMGRDVGIPALHAVAPSAVLEHNAHHRHPEMIAPPGSPPYSIEVVVTKGLESLGLATTRPGET